MEFSWIRAAWRSPSRNYNALEIAFKQRLTHGLTAQSAFTFSKALGYGTGTDAVLDDPYNLRYDHGPLPYDFRKQWVTSFIYQIPIPQSWAALPRHILGAWEAAGLVTLQGGNLPAFALIAGRRYGGHAHRPECLCGLFSCSRLIL